MHNAQQDSGSRRFCGTSFTLLQLHHACHFCKAASPHAFLLLEAASTCGPCRTAGTSCLAHA
eukprot:1161595-Pelagomonas_calceolata.AAC.2